jgi:hypothetical protein
MREKPRLGRSLKQLDEALGDLADEYRKVGERHAAEVDVFHMAHTLAAQCDLQAQSLGVHAERYGTELPNDDQDGLWNGILAQLRRTQADSLRHSSLPGLLLLHDLRQLHLVIEEAAMLWLVIDQVAQAVRDPELLEVVTQSREEITKHLMWVTTRIKETAPQVLAS